jgi:hypothetical protein
MDAPAQPSALEARLDHLASLGERIADAVTRMIEIDRAMADIAFTWLPDPARPASTSSEAAAAVQKLAAVAAVLAAAVPRIEALALAYDRVSRSVRRTVALQRRLQTGWPRASSPDKAAPDTRSAMQKRQVKNGVSEKIRCNAEEDAAEDLFAELDDHLGDPGLDAELQAFTVEQVVDRICRDIGLAAASCAPLTDPRRPHPQSECGAHPPDSS